MQTLFLTSSVSWKTLCASQGLLSLASPTPNTLEVMLETRHILWTSEDAEEIVTTTPVGWHQSDAQT